MVNALIRANAQQDAQHEPLAPHQLQVAIIGAGATGVELSAELHRTTREVVAYGLDRINPEQDLQLHLIEAAERVLPGLPERMSTAARQMLEGIGVQVHTGAKVAEVLPEGVRLGNGQPSSQPNWWFGPLV